MLLRSVDAYLTCNNQETASLERTLIPATSTLPAHCLAEAVHHHLTPCSPPLGCYCPHGQADAGRAAGMLGRALSVHAHLRRWSRSGVMTAWRWTSPRKGAGGCVAQADGRHLLTDARADTGLQVVQHRPNPHLHRPALVHHQLPDLDAPADRSSECTVVCYPGCHNAYCHLCNAGCRLGRLCRRRHSMPVLQSDKANLHCRCFCANEHCQSEVHTYRAISAS